MDWGLGSAINQRRLYYSTHYSNHLKTLSDDGTLYTPGIKFGEDLTASIGIYIVYKGHHYMYNKVHKIKCFLSTLMIMY